MSIKWCPRCDQPYCHDPMCSDYVHECNSGTEELDQESVKVIGEWVDYSGSGTKPSTEALQAGTANKLMGEETMNEVFEDDKNVWGENKSVRRQRQHLEYIKH